MSEPWLAIIGLGEDGPAGLTEASRAALEGAEVVFGAARHLALVGARGREWPVPFDLAPLLECRGRRVAMLVSGDPFWFGAGGTLAAHLQPGEWRAYPVAGVFSLVAARLAPDRMLVVALALLVVALLVRLRLRGPGPEPETTGA